MRRIVYFNTYGISGHLIVLASNAVAGVIITIKGSIIRERRTTTGNPAADGRSAPLR